MNSGPVWRIGILRDKWTPDGAAHPWEHLIISGFTLWGFDGSTYVRTIKMLIAERGCTQFDQVPLNGARQFFRLPSEAR